MYGKGKTRMSLLIQIFNFCKMNTIRFNITSDKQGTHFNSFLISPQKHMLWALLTSTHNICFCGEIIISTLFWFEKKKKKKAFSRAVQKRTYNKVLGHFRMLFFFSRSGLVVLSVKVFSNCKVQIIHAF